MTLFPFLPFCRQSMPAKGKLLDDIRSLIRLTRHSQDGLPRIRIRSLDVIPLSLSLHRHSSIQSVTQHIDPNASIDHWLTLQPGSHFATHIVTALCAFYSASSSSPIPRLPSLMTWNPSSLKTIHTHKLHLNSHTFLNYLVHISASFKKLSGPLCNTTISICKRHSALFSMPLALINTLAG